MNLWPGCGTVNFLHGVLFSDPRSEEVRNDATWDELTSGGMVVNGTPLLNLKEPWKMSDFSRGKHCQNASFLEVCYVDTCRSVGSEFEKRLMFLSGSYWFLQQSRFSVKMVGSIR